MPIQFSFSNVADDATLSGGSWLAGAPLSNLQQEFLSLRARSTNAVNASTKLNIDLGATNIIVRFVAVARHNLSRDARFRVSAGTTNGGTNVYTSGWQDVWPAVYLPADLEWEDDNFWTGQISAAEAESYPISGFLDTGANYRARYWTIEFDDTTNPDGYVEIARLWLGPLWSPQRNYSFGAQFGWEPRDVSEYSLGGVLHHERRHGARVLRVNLKGLTATEAYGALLDAQRLLGTVGQLWVIPQAGDLARGFKRNFMARFRKVDPITQAFLNLYENALELEEIL